jgi:hypothetical protein
VSDAGGRFPRPGRAIAFPGVARAAGAGATSVAGRSPSTLIATRP